MRVVVHRTKKKIISLRVDENGVLQVLAYTKLSLEKIRNFVEGKRDWVLQQTDGLRNRTPTAAQEAECAAAISSGTFSSACVSDMFAGKKCLLFGEVLNVRPTVESKSYLESDVVYLPEKYFDSRDQRVKALKSYLKKLSVQNVSEEISKFGSHTALCPTRIEFRNLSTGWVKCTQPFDKVITLDYRICQLPDKLQHYLIVHAFCHFTNIGHDDAFWDTVSNYVPRYKSCEEELKQYDFLKDI